MVRLACPSCTHELVVENAPVGATIGCPACGRPVAVPTPMPSGVDEDQYATVAPTPGESRATGGGLVPPGLELLGGRGRGGMGVVYRARETCLNRVVALKMILAGGHAGAEERQRFLAEAEAIARVTHPGIVQVHEYGVHAGLPYFAL